MRLLVKQGQIDNKLILTCCGEDSGSGIDFALGFRLLFSCNS